MVAMRKLLFGVLGSLLVAWILTFFNVNKMLFEVFEPIATLTNSHYYIAFVALGLIIGLIRPRNKN
jgi:uncharacterized membrane protein YeaQ/YmgE (transglycosylase-associated protein family)